MIDDHTGGDRPAVRDGSTAGAGEAAGSPRAREPEGTPEAADRLAPTVDGGHPKPGGTPDAAPEPPANLGPQGSGRARGGLSPHLVVLPPDSRPTEHLSAQRGAPDDGSSGRRAGSRSSWSGRSGGLHVLLTGSLRSSRTVDEVVDTVTAFLVQELGAAWVGLLLHEHKRGTLRNVGGTPAARGGRAWASVTSSTSGPVALAIARRRLLAFDDAADLATGFPEVERWGPPPASGPVAFAPLLLAAGALGVLVVWWGGADPVTHREEPTLMAVARHVAQAVDRIEAAAEQRADAETLQRSLLTLLPRPDGLELHARYVPAGRGREIGGDWYDAIILDDGSTVLMIGDVTGHDMTAAAQMGQLRGLLRGFAYDRDEPPSASVCRLERACAGLGLDSLATLVLARISAAPTAQGARQLCWTNAGHLPPVLLHPDGSTELLESPSEALVGLRPDAVRTDHFRLLPPGTTLLLYTDGLVERRDRDIRSGIGELRTALARLHRLPVPILLGMLVTAVAGDHPPDDVALLAVRPRGGPPSVA